MKKFFVIMFALALAGSQVAVNAQNGAQKKQRPSEDQICQHQCDQMVKMLMLDDATSAKFTSLYTQYLKELMACRASKRSDEAKASQDGANKELTDAEIDQHIRAQFTKSRKMLDIRENYYDKFRKILSPRQIQKIYRAERQNADKFKKTLRQRRDGKSMGPKRLNRQNSGQNMEN